MHTQPRLYCPFWHVKSKPYNSRFFHTRHSDGGLSFSNLSMGAAPMVDASLPSLRGSYARVKLKQCSSSLLLCKCWESQEDEECEYIVYNPMMGQWTVLHPIVWQDEEDDEPAHWTQRGMFVGKLLSRKEWKKPGLVIDQLDTLRGNCMLGICFLNYYQLSVWVLEDYASEVWTLKHTIDVPQMFGGEYAREDCDEEDKTFMYEMFAIHPDRNFIFLTDWKEVNLSYDMDSREVQLMCNSGDFMGGLPYIPCFADLVDG
uniref:F-box associated domain-containing protein n=1 Tax=Aegilops tauschii TaxID=37682 RepID=M8BAI6_AEGTA